MADEFQFDPKSEYVCALVQLQKLAIEFAGVDVTVFTDTVSSLVRCEVRGLLEHPDYVGQVQRWESSFLESIAQTEAYLRRADNRGLEPGKGQIRTIPIRMGEDKDSPRGAIIEQGPIDLSLEQLSEKQVHKAYMGVVEMMAGQVIQAAQQVFAQIEQEFLLFEHCQPDVNDSFYTHWVSDPSAGKQAGVEFPAYLDMQLAGIKAQVNEVVEFRQKLLGDAEQKNYRFKLDILHSDSQD